ncbi:MAG: cbb3-type cytochrome c oxidase subunit 3 [Pseudomonadota bacterium]
METYSFLREFADSWFLLFMTLFYVGCIVFAFRPGAKKVHKEISQIPLRDDDWLPKAKPKDVPLCTKNCATCPCSKLKARA